MVLDRTLHRESGAMDSLPSKGRRNPQRWRRAAIAFGIVLVVGGSALAGSLDRPWFADRPVAWQEHDDQDIPHAPKPTLLQDAHATLILRDSLAGEVDRVLALDTGHPAQDVNALDEVPCSTWFCARNHLVPMSPERVAAGPPLHVPRLPLRIVKGKEEGASLGFQVADANGNKFMLKLDPVGHLGLTTGPEMLGERFFHAAGYNVPGAYSLDLRPQDLLLDPKATFLLFDVEKRPLAEVRVQELLSQAAHDAEGRLRVVATPWVEGKILGGFDMIGQRSDDPNDRIPHEHRRSLRATWVLFGWLQELDPGSINTLDTYVTEAGRHFVRHYIIDFGAIIGSFTIRPKGVHEGTEYVIEVGRTLEAFASLGLYRRPFQDDRSAWREQVTDLPSAGWFPAEDFDPEEYRPRIKVPAHMRRTARDLYWGAKVVTSFTDAQIDAVVTTARMPPRDEAYVNHALKIRRDIIGRRYLRPMTAVENPAVAPDGSHVCFDDLAIARGYIAEHEVRYQVDVTDGNGIHLAASSEGPTNGARGCVPVGGPGPGTGYRIIQVTTSLVGDTEAPAISKAARIHLRWRQAARRFVVVGLERDE
jgi:hypothetical protein